MTRSARSLLLTLLAASISASALAQNLLLNGNFDTSISSWDQNDPGAGTTVFSPLDAGGSASSGSVLVTNNSAPIGGNPGVFQCRPATPGASYDYGAKARVALGQLELDAYILVNFFANPTCSGSGIGASSAHFTPSGSWQGLTVTGFTAPAGTVTVSLRLLLFKRVAGGSVTANFDDAFLVPTGSARATLTVPVAASIHGANSTFFHSDAWIFNRSFTNSNVVTLVYRCFGGVGCGTSKQITLHPRESRLITDIIGTLFGVPESGGAIEISHDTFNGPIAARTRLFTPSSPPSYGFGVPAFQSTQTTSRAVFLGIAGSGTSLTTGYRSNAGAYNPNGVPVTVTLTLYDGPTGAQIGSPYVRVWAPFEAAQVSKVFETLGAGAMVTTNAVLVATSAGGEVFFYAATIDNVSGDSFWIIAADDEPPVP
jgi:hypothetical protein